MLNRALIGLAAGTAGTVALNVATYADMAIRSRAASQVPAQLATKLAGTAGVDLSPDSGDSSKEKAGNRSQGIGALLGYVNGLGLGVVYGLLRPSLSSIPPAAGGAALGVAAMAGSDVPATLAGVTDPRTWGATSWILDLAFHLVYGLTTAFAYDALSKE